nr:MAG TPA: hypothetical protein [Bacteriophage sp.]
MELLRNSLSLNYRDRQNRLLKKCRKEMLMLSYKLL